MIIVFESILPIFALIALGFSLRKGGFVPKDHWNVIEELSFWIFFPALLIQTLMNADLEGIKLDVFIYTLVATVLSMAVLVLCLWPILKTFWRTKPTQFSSIYQTSTRWHGFIALAIVYKLFGNDGAALVAVTFAVIVPFLQVSNILVLIKFSDNKDTNLNKTFITILKNPIIWGVIIGMLANLLQIQPWEPVNTFINLLANAALTTSLLALGAGLRLQAALKPSKELWVGLIAKLAITPALMALWAIYFQVEGVAFSVLIICASVPTAMNGYIISKKMGGDAELYAATATVQTLVSFFSMPVILWLSQQSL